MRTNYAPFIAALVITGAVMLACGCTVPAGEPARNRTNSTPVEETLTIDEVLEEDGNFSAFLRAFKASGLGGMLAGSGPYTVFAPTDEAFDRLSGTVTEELFDDPKGSLAEILLYHMAPGIHTTRGIAANDTVATVQGNPAPVVAVGGNLAVGGARVIRGDIPAANGVIHVIDAVMVPPDATLPAANETAAGVTANTTA